MNTPILSELREPPIAGKYYLVPTVEYRLRGLKGPWPVIGPRHDDATDLNFPHLHYHLDGRFLSDRMLNAIGGWYGSKERAVAAVVLTEPRNIENCEWTATKYGRLPAKPTLRRRKCRHSIWTYPPSARASLIKHIGEDRIGARLGLPAKAIHRRNGQVLCPHRKVDLSSLPRDREGMVTCPLHGLKVDCSQVPA